MNRKQTGSLSGIRTAALAAAAVLAAGALWGCGARAGGTGARADVVKDGQKRGTVGGSVKLYFSLDDMLKWVFSKKERNKRKNRKRDDTWRYYNSMP